MDWNENTFLNFPGISELNETDPVVGSVDGVVIGNGDGSVRAGVAGTDYAKVDSTTCSGTDKVVSINSATGVVGCGADQSGGSGSDPGGVTGDWQKNAGSGAFGGFTPASGIEAWIIDPTSAKLATAVTGETGSGPLVFGTSPTLGGTVTLGGITGSTQCLHVNSSGAISGTGADCGAGGSGSPGGTDGQIQYRVDGSTFGGVTLGTGLDITDGVLTLRGVGVDKSSSGTSIDASDAGKVVEIGAFTYTLAQAGTTGFETGWQACLLNKGAGNATVNATTSTFDGAGGTTSMTIRPGAWACPRSDGTDYPTVAGVKHILDISGLAANVATALQTPSSANVAAAVTDETGSGALVFGTSPTLTTPNLGTPSAINLANGTALPISTGVAGLGTGVATALATPSSANLRAALTDETGTGAAVFATGPTMSSLTLSDVTGSTQCLHVNSSGVVSGTGSDCGAGGGGSGQFTIQFFGTATNTNVYLGNIAQTSAIAAGQYPVPFNMTVSDLTCVSQNDAGSGNTHTYIINVNGSNNTNQQKSIAGSSQRVTDGLQAGDTNVGIALSTGDLVTMHLTISGGTVNSRVVCTLKAVPA